MKRGNLAPRLFLKVGAYGRAFDKLSVRKHTGELMQRQLLQLRQQRRR